MRERLTSLAIIPTFNSSIRPQKPQKPPKARGKILSATILPDPLTHFRDERSVVVPVDLLQRPLHGHLSGRLLLAALMTLHDFAIVHHDPDCPVRKVLTRLS